MESTRCFCIRNLTRSLRSLVRFLIRQQLVRKYRTPALSMKYSLYTRQFMIHKPQHHGQFVTSIFYHFFIPFFTL